MIKSDKKYVVITGASSGIGYATAKAFAKRGKNLIIVARSENDLSKLKDEVLKNNPSLDVIVKPVDLSKDENAHELFQELETYEIETWVNNAGFGNYDSVAHQDLNKIETMLNLNVKALTIFSTLYVHKYKDVEGTQLINISSAGGYIIVPTAITYCATKFYVSTFTEGLARELEEAHAKMQAKVLAPAATKTNFGNVANNINNYNYDNSFGKYHTKEQMAEFLLKLYDSNKTVGAIDRETFDFRLLDPQFPYAGESARNQKIN